MLLFQGRLTPAANTWTKARTDIGSCTRVTAANILGRSAPAGGDGLVSREASLGMQDDESDASDVICSLFGMSLPRFCEWMLTDMGEANKVCA